MLRLLSTRRGLLSLLGFALIWAAILAYGIVPAARLFSATSEASLVHLLADSFGVVAFRNWPTPELAVYWIVCLYLLPFLAILTAADQTASDRARGTLRYLVLRCNRLEIFFGRFLGQVCILSLVVLVTLLSVLLVIGIHSPQLLAESLAASPVVVVNLLLLLLPYIALMALVSILASTARQATLYAVILWLVVSLASNYLKHKLPQLSALDWVLPGSQVRELVSLASWDTLTLAPIPLVHTFVLLVVGAILMQRRDL